MSEEITNREMALLKLIDIQAKEITQLGMEVELLRYNKRYTNTKYKIQSTIPELKERLSEPKKEAKKR